MSKRAATFTEADVKRAIKAVRAAGLAIGGVEVTTDGTIRIVLPDGKAIEPVASEEWRL